MIATMSGALPKCSQPVVCLGKQRHSDCTALFPGGDTNSPTAINESAAY